MKRLISTLLICLFSDVALPQWGASFGVNGVIDINDVLLWATRDGISAKDPNYGSWGFVYPRGAAGLVSCDNLVWVSKVYDGITPTIRTGGGLWTTYMNPGVILPDKTSESYSDPHNRIYRIRKDYQSADLREDAAEFFATTKVAVSPSQVASIRSQYEKDWQEWPWQKGAPFVDVNNNGVMDGGDYPGIQNADQVLWFAYNDLSSSLFASPKIGLEIQVTMWAYDGIREFQNVVFKRYRFIYKGTPATPANATIDSMFICQWSETDVGFHADDLAGCDSVLSLGFAYNADVRDEGYASYSIFVTPAVGYQVLQGPMVPSSSADTALFGFEKKPGYRNLQMTSCIVKPTPSVFPESEFEYSYYWWNALRGNYPYRAAENESWIDPWGNVTKFVLSGDPLTNTGWIDGKIYNNSQYNTFYNSPGGRRLFVNTGPFSMAVGDTQEVVIAILAALAPDPPMSVTSLKAMATELRMIYPELASTAAEKPHNTAPNTNYPEDFKLRQNFPNPFNPATSISYSLPTARETKLAVYDMLGRIVTILDSGDKPPGDYEVKWDGKDKAGREMPSGVYFYRLNAGSVVITKKMLLLR